MFKSLVTDIQSVYRNARDDLRRALDRFDKSLQDVGLWSVLKVLEGYKGCVLWLDVYLIDSAEKRLQVLNWLSPERFNHTYDTFQATRVKNSGTWFLTSPKFQHWVKGLSNLFIVTGMGM